MVSTGDTQGINRVLNAAALTYVAAAASAIMTLLYFLIRAGLLGGDEQLKTHYKNGAQQTHLLNDTPQMFARAALNYLFFKRKIIKLKVF